MTAWGSWEESKMFEMRLLQRQTVGEGRMEGGGESSRKRKRRGGREKGQGEGRWDEMLVVLTV